VPSTPPEGPQKEPSGSPPRDEASTPRSAEPGPSSEPSSRISLPEARDRFGIGLLVPLLLAGVAANVIAGLLAPGWAGVGSEQTVLAFRRWGGLTALTAAILGLATLVSLTGATVGNPRTSTTTRLVSTFGAGLVCTFVAEAVARPLEPQHLVVLFAGAFAVLVSGSVEGLGPPRTRALGVQLALLSLASLLRVTAWGIALRATLKGSPGGLAASQAIAACALVAEMGAHGFLVAYLVYRPGVRGAGMAIVGLGVAFALTTWALGTTIEMAGAGRDALQRALSLRVQGSGPMPSWVAQAAQTQEIVLLERPVRLQLVPLVMCELSSITLAVAALGSATRATLPVMAAMGLAALSRGQVDTPVRALQLATAALAALVLSRAVRDRT